nr:PPE domain-containing protein [Saccharopolyspora hordei]
MDIPQLQEWITQVKQGRGTESMQSAVRALDECVKVVVELDETLRRELGKLQIAWEGNAGDLAAAATQQQAVFLSDAPDPLRASAQSVDAQGRSYESTRHTLPNTDELRHKQSENVLEWVGGAFGYESDYDQEAKQIDAHKKAAQAALGSYRDTSVSQAEAYRPLPEVPPATVTPQSTAPSGVVGAGLGGVGSASAGTVAGSAQPGVPTPGTANPGQNPGQGVGAVPGGGVLPGQGLGDGRTGRPNERVAPPKRTGERREDERDRGGEADPTPEAAGDSGGVSAGTVLGIAAGGAAVAGIGAYAASKVLGGRAAPAPAGGPGGAVGDGKTAARGIGGGPGDTVAGKAAGSTPGSRPAAGSMMSPAATRGEKRSEDAEHENKYVAEETPFDDERLVAPPVLGGDQRDDEKPAETETEQKQD